MTQRKAASLTSELFARKGAATPASTELAEPQRGEAPVIALVPGPPPRPASQEPGSGAPAAAGGPAPDGGPAPEPDESGVRAEDLPAGSPGSGSEPLSDGAAEDGEEADDSVCETAGEGEPPPAASLELCDLPRNHVRPAEQAAAAKAAGAGAATAPGESAVAAKPATADDAAPDRSAPAADTREPDVVPVPASPRRFSWPLAAAVAVAGLAVGLGLYFVLSEPGRRGAELALAPATEPRSEPAATTATAEPADTPQVAEAIPGDAAPAETAAPAPDDGRPLQDASSTGEPQLAPEPVASFDVVRIEPDGDSLLAGRAPPYSEWIVLNNGEPIGTVTADGVGQWLLLPGTAVTPGDNRFSLVPKSEQGGIAVPAVDSADQPASDTGARPAPEEDAGLAAPAGEEGVDARALNGRLEGLPAAEVGGAAGASAPPDGEGVPLSGPDPDAAAPEGAGPSAAPVPARKPDGAEAEAGSRDQADAPGATGGYDIQIASVRSAEDAARERERLLAEFEELLTPLGLRVDQADVAGAGTYFRIRGGPLPSLADARTLCRELEAGGQDCLVVKN